MLENIKKGVKNVVEGINNLSETAKDLGLNKQLRSVIEWTNPQPDLLLYKWSEDGDEIKNASKLIVNPGQGCLFIYQGKIESIFTENGLYDLATDNRPFITTFKKYMQGFESEHKAGIYFYNTGQILNVKWGTTSMVKYRDPEYKFPVSIGIHGNYSLRVTDVEMLFRQVSHNVESYSANDLKAVLVGRLMQNTADFLATSRFSFIEVDSNLNEIADEIKTTLPNATDALGVAIIDFRIEGTKFDDATNARIAQIADAQAKAQSLDALGTNMVQQQQLEILKEAAKNEGGGLINTGVTLGAGLNLGNQIGGLMGGVMNNATNNATNNNQNPTPDDIEAKLGKLKNLFDKGLIDEAEYKAKKQTILNEL